MKKIIPFILIVLLAGCSKSNDDKAATGNFCWSCEVTRWTDNVTFHKDTCTKQNYSPQFKDINGNDENAVCQPK